MSYLDDLVKAKQQEVDEAKAAGLKIKKARKKTQARLRLERLIKERQAEIFGATMFAAFPKLSPEDRAVVSRILWEQNRDNHPKDWEVMEAFLPSPLPVDFAPTRPVFEQSAEPVDEAAE